MPDLTTLIDQIEKLHQAATAGEWGIAVVATLDYACAIEELGPKYVPAGKGMMLAKEDAALIVALHNAWPALREQLRRQGEELAALITFARDVRDNYECDSDAHKHGTTCRCCAAEAALAAKVHP